MKMKIFTVFLSVLILISMVFVFSTDSLAFPYINKGTMNGVSYATGGVGIGEREDMNKMVPAFNLKLVFAVKNGNYLADVNVAIAKPDGGILVQTLANGPWLLADLPNGTYEVTAWFRQKKKVRMVEIRGALKIIMFHWSGDSEY